MSKQPTLTLAITYNHASGFFTARLPSGASFSFDIKSVSGKLENNLRLFARGVVAEQSGGYVQKPETPPEFDYTYDEASVRRFRANGRPSLDIGNLELELDLEL